MDEKVHQIKLLLEKNNFQKIPTDMEFVNMYGIIRNNDLFLLNIIELNDKYKISFEQYEKYKEITGNQFSKQAYEKIFLLNIYININNELEEEIKNIEPDYNNVIVDFHWILDLKKNKIVVPKNQPNNYLEIGSIVKSVLNETGYKNITKLKHKTDKALVTNILIISNILIWSIMSIVGSSTDAKTLIDFGAIYTERIINNNEYYRLFTSIFLHIGFIHLFYNMFALYLFGNRVEKILGNIKFLEIYLICGLAGSIFTVIPYLVQYTEAPLIAAGASGAIYGIEGAALYIITKTKCSLSGINQIIILIMVLTGFIIGLLTPNVGNLAHLGGFLSGYILAIFFMDS